MAEQQRREAAERRGEAQRSVSSAPVQRQGSDQRRVTTDAAAAAETAEQNEA